MASMNIEEIINKEVERRVAEQLELRKEEAIKAAQESLNKIKEISNENTEAQNKIALQLKTLEANRREFETITQEKEQYFHDCSKNLEQRAEAIQRSLVDSSEEKLVTINMGGKVFTTLKTTLCNMSPFFANMFSDKWRDANLTSIKDKDGNIFIDRDPTFFPLLLNWARDGCDGDELKKIISLSNEFINKLFRSCPQKSKCKSFIKTLDYLGIEYLPEPREEEKIQNILQVGQKVRLYWRGDRRTFEGCVIKKLIKCHGGYNPRHGYIKNGIGLNKKEVFVDILYDDGDIWRYKEKRLVKESGPFAKQKCSTRHETKFWHYGTEFGSKKISWKGIRVDPNTDDSSDDDNDN